MENDTYDLRVLGCVPTCVVGTSIQSFPMRHELLNVQNLQQSLVAEVLDGRLLVERASPAASFLLPPLHFDRFVTGIVALGGFGALLLLHVETTLVDECISAETFDRLVDAHDASRCERHQPDVLRKRTLLDLLDELRELRVGARAIVDLEQQDCMNKPSQKVPAFVTPPSMYPEAVVFLLLLIFDFAISSLVATAVYLAVAIALLKNYLLILRKVYTLRVHHKFTTLPEFIRIVQGQNSKIFHHKPVPLRHTTRPLRCPPTPSSQPFGHRPCPGKGRRTPAPPARHEQLSDAPLLSIHLVALDHLPHSLDPMRLPPAPQVRNPLLFLFEVRQFPP